MRNQRGSITVFSTIALLLISASIFVLLEGVRYQNLNYLADLQTDLALDAALSNYNSCLWENYHLLGADYSIAKEIIDETSNAKSDGNGINLLGLKREDVSMVSYTLLTDRGGTVFVNSVSSYMKNFILYETIKEIYSQYESIKALTDSDQMDVSNIEEALENIESMEVSDKNSIGTSGLEGLAKEQKVVSILETAKQWLETGLLELVLKDARALSKAELDFKNGVLERELDVGKNFVSKEISWEDRILFQQYLRTYMSHYNDVKANRACDYEVEYLLGAKESDIKNLECVVTKLFAVREAANYLHLISNPQKLAKAEGMATLLAGASLNPIVIKAVKIGLLTAWAFAESILDVRALLDGKRIAFIKSEESWTTDLEDIEEITKGFAMAKESQWGLGYEEYLGIFLLLEDEEDLAMRALQIQEATIRKNKADDSFRIDALITQAEVSIQYSYNPVFPFLEIFDGLKDLEYKISSIKTHGYY